ncbi:hypothetical protein Patl1_19297 [Pistacia atlantica]|uniref:Uncharacterized protein n=1 Tax=Pistacia atlantica TaxID=434234 RepID=A0ACC1BYA4_9ROSI|nr:hypothetical protein Patl1_19297 [Pistacia atlantica]
MWIYFLHAKSEVCKFFKEFKIFVENQFNRKIKNLRTNNGGEFTSHEFCSFLKEHGIRRQLTCVGTPQQNGIAKRKNRHIVEVARVMPTRQQDKLDKKAVKCIFLGYSSERKAYRYYNPLKRRIYESRDVAFDENSQWYPQFEEHNKQIESFTHIMKEMKKFQRHKFHFMKKMKNLNWRL